MPVRDLGHWASRVGQAAPCHYGDRWLDLYADWIRKSAVRRIFPAGVRSVLDVGCGDGRFGAWIESQFRCQVTGVDCFDWPGARERVEFVLGDAERLRDRFQPLSFDLATCVTVLQCTQDWRAAVQEVTAVARSVLVVENLQTPTPPWQRGLPEKGPIEFPPLVAEFRSQGFFLSTAVCVNLVDRRGFPPMLPVPRWCAPACCVGTFVVDWVLSRCVQPERGRYAAVLFERLERRRL